MIRKLEEIRESNKRKILKGIMEIFFFFSLLIIKNYFD